MIFTGVTGGEIVSLLYPLFILSPFCYIIISKESLDGSPRIHYRDGGLPFFEKMPGRLSDQRPAGRRVCLSVLHYERRQYVVSQGGDHVFDIPGGADSRAHL